MIKDPEVMENVEKFLKLAHKYGHRSYRGKANAKYFGYKVNRKYIYVKAGAYHFNVCKDTGNIHCSRGGRPAYCLNIRDFLYEDEWKERKIGCSSICIPVKKNKLKCDRCGRDKYVKDTSLGHLCQYCRASVSRHAGIIRSLGVTPKINSVPISGRWE